MKESYLKKVIIILVRNFLFYIKIFQMKGIRCQTALQYKKMLKNFFLVRIQAVS